MYFYQPAHAGECTAGQTRESGSFPGVIKHSLDNNDLREPYEVSRLTWRQAVPKWGHQGRVVSPRVRPLR